MLPTTKRDQERFKGYIAQWCYGTATVQQGNGTTVTQITFTEERLHHMMKDLELDLTMRWQTMAEDLLKEKLAIDSNANHSIQELIDMLADKTQAIYAVEALSDAEPLFSDGRLEVMWEGCDEEYRLFARKIEARIRALIGQANGMPSLADDQMVAQAFSSTNNPDSLNIHWYRKGLVDMRTSLQMSGDDFELMVPPFPQSTPPIARAVKDGDTLVLKPLEETHHYQSLLKYIPSNTVVYVAPQPILDVVDSYGTTRVSIPRGYKLLKDSTHAERDWPDVGENSQYCNHCSVCERSFVGYKRRGICRVCSSESVNEKAKDIK